jgi:hypothetical protein
LGALALLGSVACVLLCGAGVRFLGLRSWVVRATGLSGYAVAGVFVATGILLVFLGPTPPLAVAGLPAALVLLVAPMLVVTHSARRCLAAAKLAPIMNYGS